MENAFYFILKTLFFVKIFKFLSRIFGHVGKMAWLERQGQLPNSWRHNLAYKQLQYKYCPISHKVNENEIWSINII